MTAHGGCAARERPRFELGDIVRRHRDELERARTLSTDQSRALSAIALCRTPALGGHLDVCTACGHEQPSYNSCRNRHCPKCQGLAQEKWVAERLERILPVPHFHVVFTLPAALRSLAAFRPKRVYDMLFKSASATLLEVARGEKLGALLGITAVLHTWTRELELHPHLHCIVTGGGLAPDGDEWIRADDYLLPVRVLATVFRGKFLDVLRREHARRELAGFHLFADPEGFERFCSAITKRPWIVFAKQPLATSDHVFRYLGRYTHRVAIANSRLLDVTPERVRFRTKDGRAITLAPVDFLARFIQHVLPSGYVKIRHYGLYAASNVKTRLQQARALLPASTRCAAPLATSWVELLLALSGRDVRLCERCGGPLVRVRALRPRFDVLPRGPP